MMNRNVWVVVVALSCLWFGVLGCSGEEKKPEPTPEPTKEAVVEDATAAAPEDAASAATTVEDATGAPAPEDDASVGTEEADASPSDPDATSAGTEEADASPSDPDVTSAGTEEAEADAVATPPEPAAAKVAAPFELGKVKGFELSADWFFAEAADAPEPSIARIQEAVLGKRADLTACGLLERAPTGDAPAVATVEWVITDKGKIKKPDVKTPEGMDKKQAKALDKCLTKAVKDLDFKALKGADDLAVRYHFPLSAAPTE